ncbi:DUF4143 domain-containing protein [Ramlibacter sp.]|uniref:DUF4143 domain-containing protein n=1 Tax=Ramlibacter sp. TaxID=1917967 RepID=UPI003D0D60F4
MPEPPVAIELQIEITDRSLNFRFVRTPKLNFTDSGLVSWLLGIDAPGALVTYPARGALFETWVVSELLKHTWNQGGRFDREGCRVLGWRELAGR